MILCRNRIIRNVNWQFLCFHFQADCLVTRGPDAETVVLERAADAPQSGQAP